MTEFKKAKEAKSDMAGLSICVTNIVIKPNDYCVLIRLFAYARIVVVVKSFLHALFTKDMVTF